MRKLLSTLAICAALPASADTAGPFDQFFVFGDSLSDSGNLAAVAPEFVPFPPYPDGQFTNGDTWATQLGLAPSVLGGTNFAFGGARAVENGDSIPDLNTQLGMFDAVVSDVADHASDPYAAADRLLEDLLR